MLKHGSSSKEHSVMQVSVCLRLIVVISVMTLGKLMYFASLVAVTKSVA